MKPIDKLLGSALKIKRTSLALTNSFGRNSVVNTRDQRKILEQRKKNQQERLKTFRSAIDAVKQKEQDSGNKTNALLGGLGLSALAGGALGRMRGGKPRVTTGTGGMIPGGKPRSVRVPTGGLPRPGVLPKGRLPRVGGPLNVAFAGVDFAMRKGSGQTNLQAGAGAGAGLLGGLGGMKAGAMAGGAIGAMFGGVGAIPGAAIGGVLGSLLGGSLASGVADKMTGADARRIEETKRSGMMLVKTPFGTGLDSFDRALGKLEKLNILYYPKPEPTVPVEPKGKLFGFGKFFDKLFGKQDPKPNPNPSPTPSPSPAPQPESPPLTEHQIEVQLSKLRIEELARRERPDLFNQDPKPPAPAPVLEATAALVGGPNMSPRTSVNPVLTLESRLEMILRNKSATPDETQSGQGNPITKQKLLMKRLEREYPEGIPREDLQQLNPSLKDRINEQILREGGEKVSMILPVEGGQNQQPMISGGGSGGGIRVIPGPSASDVARYIIDLNSQVTG